MQNKTYFRLKKLALEEVFPCIHDIYKDENGFRVKPVMNITETLTVNAFSVRLKTFKDNVECVSCGIKGEYFYAERQHNGNTKRYHLNMYGIDSSGYEILMTKDHIIPKSKGGSDHIDNMQTMCIKCNQAKGNGDENSVFCPHPKIRPKEKKKGWDIKLNDLVCKFSRKKFESRNRVEKVVGFTSAIFKGKHYEQVILTNCNSPVTVISINNDAKEVELLSKRDVTNPL